MAQGERLDPVDYLDRFFDELRQEVRSNPQFASRLVKALGGEVVFEDARKGDVANPFSLAADAPKSRFYAVFASMKPSELKRMLKDYNLATAVDMRGKRPAELLDMLYERASAKVAERSTGPG